MTTNKKIINVDIYSNLVILQFKIKFKLVISYILFQLKVFRYIFQFSFNVNMASVSPVTFPGEGNSVNLRTFESWGKSSVLGRKTIMVNGVEMVNFMWCKLCANTKYKFHHT